MTGSNIPTANEVGPNPVLTINRDFIEKSGERTAEELIRNLTVAGPNGVPTSNNGTSPAVGAPSISLRGFYPSDTLTLIDGRRVATYPLGTGPNPTQTFVDLNSIPRAAIDSIEILKDGASTTYGADAVAGVVNIKLRHDYRGAETSFDYGNTLDKDSSEFSASLVFGAGDAKSNVTGVLNFYYRNSIFTRDRGYSSRAPRVSGNTSPANLELSRAAVLAAGGNPPADLGDTFFGRAPFFTDGNAPASQYSYSSSLVRDFNFNAFSGSLPDSERYGAEKASLSVKVIDFGLAKAVSVTDTNSAQAPFSFSGTPGFASPEQLRGGDAAIDARSDIYSLGATLWYLLRGNAPPALGEAEPLPLGQLKPAHLSPPAVALLRSMLAAEPSTRPQSARELWRALQRCRATVEAASRRRGLLMVAALLVALLVVSGFG